MTLTSQDILDKIISSKKVAPQNEYGTLNGI